MTTTLTPPYDADELLYSLTGYEENEIEDVFGSTVFDLAETNAAKYLRALLYAVERRADKEKAAAKKAVLGMKLSEVQDAFTDESEPIPSEPVTESGKDDSELPDEPKSSPPGA